MKGTVCVRPAIEADLAALTRLDLSYPTERVLALERSGQSGEERFTFHWRNQAPGMANYAEYGEGRLREALPRVDLFLTAEVGGEPAGLLIVIKPPWSDAGEITDLAVHRPWRRLGCVR